MDTTSSLRSRNFWFNKNSFEARKKTLVVSRGPRGIKQVTVVSDVSDYDYDLTMVIPWIPTNQQAVITVW